MHESFDLKKNLLTRYENDQLATFYLARYSDDLDPFLWAREFIHSITPLETHTDILWVKPDAKDKTKEYKVESTQIKMLMHFLLFQPRLLKKKFIFIFDAHLLGVDLSNKLLKTFEELSMNFCLFLFLPHEKNLLPTVESRGIKIHLVGKESPLIPSPHTHSAIELVSKLKKSPTPALDEKLFIEASLDRTLHAKKFIACEAALLNLFHWKQSEDYNNPQTSRLSLFVD